MDADGRTVGASNEGALTWDLFTGFEGYASPTDEDYERVLSAGLVAPDTNVLLNLYRYGDDARTALLAALKALADRLWISHQVLEEFWRNREGVLRDARGTTALVRDLSEHRERIEHAFREWANRVSLDAGEVNELVRPLADAFESLREKIGEHDLGDAQVYARNTGGDPVLQALASASKGRCGGPMSAAAKEKAVAEGLRRVETRCPPGYMDKKKGDERAAGDYVFWEQVILEAERRECDVLIITGDSKEDWWRIDGGERRGPRIELSEELRARTGRRLFILRPAAFIERAAKHLGIQVRPESVQAAERIDEFLDQTGGNWTTPSVSEFIELLGRTQPVLGSAIRLAARQGGRLTDDQVARLNGIVGQDWDSFTRPVDRRIKMLRARGVLGEEADNPLMLHFDPHGFATKFDLAFHFSSLVDPLEDERRVLRRLLPIGDSADGIRIEEFAARLKVPEFLVGPVLAALERKGHIECLITDQYPFPAAVTAVTAAGRDQIRGMMRTIDVTRPDGTTEPIRARLDPGLANLVRAGFEINSALVDDAGKLKLEFIGTVTEENLDLVQNLRALGKTERIVDQGDEDDSP